MIKSFKTTLHAHLFTYVKSVHETKNIYNCKQCSASYKSKFHLDQHISRDHLNLKPFKCSICQKLFVSKFRLGLHKTVHHEKNVKDTLFDVWTPLYLRRDFKVKNSKLSFTIVLRHSKRYSGDLVFIHLVVLLCKKALLKEIIQVRCFLIL